MSKMRVRTFVFCSCAVVLAKPFQILNSSLRLRMDFFLGLHCVYSVISFIAHNQSRFVQMDFKIYITKTLRAMTVLMERMCTLSFCYYKRAEIFKSLFFSVFRHTCLESGSFPSE